MAKEPLIQRAFLEKLERLTIHWQRSFPGLVGGHNRSRFAGPGQEFLDHRHFHYGDDLRAVNWRAYLRFDKLFLKMFQVEPRVPVRLLLDTSASMGTAAGEKFDFARRLAASLAYVGLVRLDTISIHPFADTLHDAFVCAGGRHRFAPVAEFLEGLEPQGRTSYIQVARQFISNYFHRGMVIIISDFLDDTDCERPLQYLADFGHELLLIHVWAEEDRSPPWDGELELTDAENGNRLELSFDSAARAEHVAGFDEFARGVRQLALRKGGRYIGVSSATPIEEAIFGPLLAAGAV